MATSPAEESPQRVRTIAQLGEAVRAARKHSGLDQVTAAGLQLGDLAGRRCLVLGAGGAARAVAYGLRQQGAQVALSNRSDSKAAALSTEADDFTAGGVHRLDDGERHPQDGQPDLLDVGVRRSLWRVGLGSNGRPAEQ